MTPKATRPFKFITFILLVIFWYPNVTYSQDIESSGNGNWDQIAWNPTGLPTEDSNVTIKNNRVVIPYGTTVTINDLIIGKNAELIVEGNLIVKGSAFMTNNSIGYSMGSLSTVVIYGDFTIDNQVDLSLSSYLIIYGTFTNKGSASQGSLSIDSASIYVFGDVTGNGFPPEFGCPTTSTGGYAGSTSSPTTDTCDYGNISDYENNQETFPPEIIDFLNCFDLSSISSSTVCLGSSAVFSVPNYPNVSYTWQKMVAGTTVWTDIIGANSATLTLLTPTMLNSGDQYRVKVKPTDGSTCLISISRNVSLTVTLPDTWLGTTSSDWSDATNWSCSSIPDLNSNVIIPAGTPNNPIISAGVTGNVNNITIENSAALNIDGGTLRVTGLILNYGSLDATIGTLEMLGITAQDISATAFLNNSIQNLIVNNIAGVSLLSPTNVSGTVSLASGNLISNGNLTLTSDATKTALIETSGSNTVIGTVNMQRYLSNPFGYKYISSPFSNSTVGDLGTYINLNNTFPLIYSYNENNEYSGQDISGWTAYTTSTDPLNSLEGYAVNFGAASTPLTIQISGNLNNGALSRTLTNNSGAFTKGFHLIGNPYPSPIDWNAPGWTKQNIDDAIYFFNAGSDQFSGTYASFVNGISSSGAGTPIIPSLQGFFVKVSDGSTSGTIGVTNQVRVNDFSQEFYKTPNSGLKHKVEDMLRLKANFTDYSNEDATVIYFDPYSSTSFEKDKDAIKLINSDINVPNIYSITAKGEELSINGMPDPKMSGIKRIPLGINAKRDGWISIKLANLKTLNYSGNIYILDNSKRTGQNLRDSDEFKVKLSKGIYNGRFELLLTNQNITDPAIAFNDLFSVLTADASIKVKLNLQEGQKGILRAITLSGQTLQSLKVQGKQEINITGIKSDGLYIISLQTEDEIVSKKILINK